MFPRFDDPHEALLDEAGQLRGGTPRKLVEWLCFKETSPFAFGAFMRIYPLYGLTAELLMDVVCDVHKAVPRQSREQVALFLADWALRRYRQDFRDNRPLFMRLLEIVSGEPSCAERLEEIFKLKQLEDVVVPVSVPVSSASPVGELDDAQKRKRLLAWTMWESTAVAEAMTVFGHDIFMRMPAHEMCDRRTRGSLDQQIAIFEHIASLVMLSVANATFPLSTLKKCIKVAQRLLALRNYNHLAAVVTGLNSARVQNLKSVWADLPARYMEHFAQYEALVSPMRNFGEYRARLQGTSKDEPCYPYLAVILKDLTYINDGNPSMLSAVGSTEETLINFKKITQLGTFIDLWRVFQQTPYRMVTSTKIMAWIAQWPALIPEDMFTLDVSEDVTKKEKVGLFKAMVAVTSNSLRRKQSGVAPDSSAAVRSTPPHSPPQSPARSPPPPHSRNSVRTEDLPNEPEGPAQDVMVIGPDDGDGLPEEAPVPRSFLWEFLARHHLEQYVSTFEAHNATKTKQLAALTDEELIRIGVDNSDHRATLLEGSSALPKNKATPTSAADASSSSKVRRGRSRLGDRRASGNGLIPQRQSKAEVSDDSDTTTTATSPAPPKERSRSRRQSLTRGASAAAIITTAADAPGASPAADDAQHASSPGRYHKARRSAVASSDVAPTDEAAGNISPAVVLSSAPSGRRPGDEPRRRSVARLAEPVAVRPLVLPYASASVSADSSSPSRAGSDLADDDTSSLENALATARGVHFYCTYSGASRTLQLPRETTIDAVLDAFRVAFSEPRLVLQLMDFEGDLISLKKQSDLEYSMLHRKPGVAITLVGTLHRE